MYYKQVHYDLKDHIKTELNKRPIIKKYISLKTTTQETITKIVNEVESTDLELTTFDLKQNSYSLGKQLKKKIEFKLEKRYGFIETIIINLIIKIIVEWIYKKLNEE